MARDSGEQDTQRSDYIIDRREGEEEKAEMACARWWCYRCRGGNGTEYRVGEVGLARGKGLHERPTSGMPRYTLPSIRPPALRKHCTIPFEPASIPKCVLVKHARGIVDDFEYTLRRSKSRENSTKDFVRYFEFAKNFVVSRISKFLLLSFRGNFFSLFFFFSLLQM